jgi:hypothetical protein
MLPLDSKRPFTGTQSDTYSNTSNMKPVRPPCDLTSQKQFSDNESAGQLGTDNYYEPQPDKWNNWVVPEDREYHREGTPGGGMSGDRQFASNRSDIQSTGYGNNMGLNEIPYGQGAAFRPAETVFVAVDRSDRGKSE